MADLRFVIRKIKEKPELKGISSEFIEEAALNFLRKEKISLNSLYEKDIRLVVKEIRKILRSSTGRFRLDFSKGNSKERHISSKERNEDFLKNLISMLDAKSILDLGCGLNPLSIASKDLKYFASDIDEESLGIVKEFFIKKGIKGKVFFADLRKPNSNLPRADLCLMLKLFDVLESNGNKLAESLVKSSKCRYILASFATKTLSGKPMNHPQRGWIERMFSRLNYPFIFYKTKNEIFYLIFKEPASLQLISRARQLQEQTNA